MTENTWNHQAWELDWLTGRIAEAIMAGVDPSLEWAKSRTWEGLTHAVEGKFGTHVQPRRPGHYSDAELETAIARAIAITKEGA